MAAMQDTTKAVFSLETKFKTQGQIKVDWDINSQDKNFLNELKPKKAIFSNTLKHKCDGRVFDFKLEFRPLDNHVPYSCDLSPRLIIYTMNWKRYTLHNINASVNGVAFKYLARESKELDDEIKWKVCYVLRPSTPQKAEFNCNTTVKLTADIIEEIDCKENKKEQVEKSEEEKKTSQKKTETSEKKTEVSEKKTETSQKTDASEENAEASEKNAEASEKNAEASDKKVGASEKKMTSQKNTEAFEKKTDTSQKTGASEKKAKASEKKAEASEKKLEASQMKADASQKKVEASQIKAEASQKKAETSKLTEEDELETYNAVRASIRNQYHSYLCHRNTSMSREKALKRQAEVNKIKAEACLDHMLTYDKDVEAWVSQPEPRNDTEGKMKQVVEHMSQVTLFHREMKKYSSRAENCQKQTDFYQAQLEATKARYKSISWLNMSSKTESFEQFKLDVFNAFEKLKPSLSMDGLYYSESVVLQDIGMNVNDIANIYSRIADIRCYDEKAKKNKRQQQAIEQAERDWVEEVDPVVEVKSVEKQADPIVEVKGTDKKEDVSFVEVKTPNVEPFEIVECTDKKEVDSFVEVQAPNVEPFEIL